MQAVVATRYGGPEALAIVDRPAPAVGPKDVLIAVRAASLNPLDLKIRAGKAKRALPLHPPIALGCDVSGMVAAVGAEVTRVKVGDEVFARLEKLRMGGLAEQVAADETVVARKPARASFEEAAAIPLAGLTALQALQDAAGLHPGQRVLIHAGAGEVGSLAIQIAKQLGLWVATTTSSGNVDFVKGLGADEVIDYTRERIADRVRDLDAVFDPLGGDSELASIELVKRGGVVVGIGGLPDVAFARARMAGWTWPAIWLATRRRRRAAARAGVRFVYWFMRPDGAQLAELASWIDAGTLRPIVCATYALAEIADAFEDLERGHARGKIVITMPVAARLTDAGRQALRLRVCRRDEVVAGALRAFSVAGVTCPVIVTIVDGALLAFQGVCPHQEVALAEHGRLSGRELTCRMHDYGFDLHTGRCAKLPSLHLTRFRATLVGEEVWIELI